MALKQVSVGLGDDLQRDLANFLAANPTIHSRSQALALLARRGLDGVVVSVELRQRLEVFRSRQEFLPDLDQVVDKLLRAALEAAVPQRELGLEAAIDRPRKSPPPPRGQ